VQKIQENNETCLRKVCWVLS